MVYYVAQVRTGKEREVATRMSRFLEPGLARALVPTRVLPLRRAGKTLREERPVFAGYVFIEAAEGALDEAFWDLRRLEDFARFLPSNQERKPLGEADLRVLSHFISKGPRADISKVTFDEDDRIVVLEGPLKGLEGSIVRVDRRKGRVRIRLALCSDSFAIDLGFEAVERVAKGPDGQHGRA